MPVSSAFQPLGLYADRPEPRLYDRVVEVLRVHRYSRRTEDAYVGWIRRFLRFHRGQVVVREGKGDKDRRTTLPAAVVPDLQTHLQRVQALHKQDLERGIGAVLLPHALDRKLPSASNRLGLAVRIPIDDDQPRTPHGPPRPPSRA